MRRREFITLVGRAWGDDEPIYEDEARTPR